MMVPICAVLIAGQGKGGKTPITGLPEDRHVKDHGFTRRSAGKRSRVYPKIGGFRAASWELAFVTAGLVPAIHVFLAALRA
jgi:hypothetical protein